MDSTRGRKECESLMRVAVGYAQAMVERLVEGMQGKGVELGEMEQAVVGEMHGFGNEMLSALVGVCREQYPAESVACECGESARYQRQRRGQCKTLLGTIQFTRSYYLCAHCHRGGCPLDKRLGICAGRFSAGLDELLAFLGCQFSFAESAKMVKRLTLVEVSPNRCRRSTEALGQLVAEDEERRRQQAWEQSTLHRSSVTQAAIDPLYISADGVMVQTRETGWREQCVGALYTAKSDHSHSKELRTQQASYLTDLGSRPRFGEQLWLEADRRGLQAAKTTVFIADGAPWLWEMAHDLFPNAIQILDWYHATSYLWTVARELYPKDEQAAQQWTHPLLVHLAHSQIDLVFQHLQPLLSSSQAARSAFTYFTHNQTRMDYARYRQLHLQIGSGTIESACKHLIDARLKQAGMRWNLDNARHVGKLRARFKSLRWSESIALRPPSSRAYSRSQLL